MEKVILVFLILLFMTNIALAGGFDTYENGYDSYQKGYEDGRWGFPPDIEKELTDLDYSIGYREGEKHREFLRELDESTIKYR